MTNQEIYDLMDRFQRSSIHSLKLSTQDVTIELAKAPVAAAPVQAMPAAFAPTVSVPGAAVSAQPELPAISAPLVGTYYAASAPDQAPFVAVGDKVKKGQTVCLIEAMKMMSEVPAPCDCVIEEVLKANGDLVAFGEALFRYKPC